MGPIQIWVAIKIILSISWSVEAMPIRAILGSVCLPVGAHTDQSNFTVCMYSLSNLRRTGGRARTNK